MSSLSLFGLGHRSHSISESLPVVDNLPVHMNKDNIDDTRNEVLQRNNNDIKQQHQQPQFQQKQQLQLQQQQRQQQQHQQPFNSSSSKDSSLFGSLPPVPIPIPISNPSATSVVGFEGNDGNAKQNNVANVVANNVPNNLYTTQLQQQQQQVHQQPQQPHQQQLQFQQQQQQVAQVQQQQQLQQQQRSLPGHSGNINSVGTTEVSNGNTTINNSNNNQTNVANISNDISNNKTQTGTNDDNGNTATNTNNNNTNNNSTASGMNAEMEKWMKAQLDNMKSQLEEQYKAKLEVLRQELISENQQRQREELQHRQQLQQLQNQQTTQRIQIYPAPTPKQQKQQQQQLQKQQQQEYGTVPINFTTRPFSRQQPSTSQNQISRHHSLIQDSQVQIGGTSLPSTPPRGILTPPRDISDEQNIPVINHPSHNLKIYRQKHTHHHPSNELSQNYEDQEEEEEESETMFPEDNEIIPDTSGLNEASDNASKFNTSKVRDLSYISAPTTEVFNNVENDMPNPQTKKNDGQTNCDSTLDKTLQNDAPLLNTTSSSTLNSSSGSGKINRTSSVTKLPTVSSASFSSCGSPVSISVKYQQHRQEHQQQQQQQQQSKQQRTCKHGPSPPKAVLDQKTTKIDRQPTRFVINESGSMVPIKDPKSNNEFGKKTEEEHDNALRERRVRKNSIAEGLKKIGIQRTDTIIEREIETSPVERPSNSIQLKLMTNNSNNSINNVENDNDDDDLTEEEADTTDTESVTPPAMSRSNSSNDLQQVEETEQQQQAKEPQQQSTPKPPRMSVIQQLKLQKEQQQQKKKQQMQKQQQEQKNELPIPVGNGNNKPISLNKNNIKALRITQTTANGDNMNETLTQNNNNNNGKSGANNGKLGATLKNRSMSALGVGGLKKKIFVTPMRKGKNRTFGMLQGSIGKANSVIHSSTTHFSMITPEKYNDGRSNDKSDTASSANKANKTDAKSADNDDTTIKFKLTKDSNPMAKPQSSAEKIQAKQHRQQQFLQFQLQQKQHQQMRFAQHPNSAKITRHSSVPLNKVSPAVPINLPTNHLFNLQNRQQQSPIIGTMGKIGRKPIGVSFDNNPSIKKLPGSSDSSNNNVTSGGGVRITTRSCIMPSIQRTKMPTSKNKKTSITSSPATTVSEHQIIGAMATTSNEIETTNNKSQTSTTTKITISSPRATRKPRKSNKKRKNISSSRALKRTNTVIGSPSYVNPADKKGSTKLKRSQTMMSPGPSLDEHDAAKVLLMFNN
eukprot:TRINITY_DN3711_c1_g1_i1.p1 TRINITY_DN3711_c1_g1~~TRINITY_DN3711_c1_g1_i1.p1  ORF type:complete len:1305 (-),score=506.04 TRINITY_DN3711_c1_g1_i1:199-3936(-)